MFFAWDITILAGTADNAPKKETLELAAGVITGISVKFPSGCHGLVKVRLNHGEFQLMPLSRAEWVTGDDEPVKMATYYELKPGMSKLKFEGSSPVCSYPHTVTIRVSILPRAVASMIPLIELLTKLFSRIGLIK